MRYDNYFKFTLDSPKKLSKQELMTILSNQMKNGTLESDLNKDLYIRLLYLSKCNYSIDEFISIVNKYVLIKDNTYIAKFYHDPDNYLESYRMSIEYICEHTIIELFDRIDSNEKKILLKKPPNDLIASQNFLVPCEIDFINHYSNFLSWQCNPTQVSNIDDIFDNYIKDESKERANIFLKYRSLIMNSLDTLNNCFNITKNYSEITDLEKLYESLKV